MEDLHTLWGHRWLTPKAKSVESAIHGWGIQAAEPISKGEIVQIISGCVVPKSEINEYRSKMGHIGIQIESDFFLVPSDRKELEQTGACNHSCGPNIGFSNQVTLRALRDINEGEELTWDYAFCESYFEPFECKCGAETCRKAIKPDDWKRPELQEKYGSWFAPYLKEKF